MAEDDVGKATEIYQSAKGKWPENGLIYTARILIDIQIYKKDGDLKRFDGAVTDFWGDCQYDWGDSDDYEIDSADYANLRIHQAKGEPFFNVTKDYWHYIAYPKDQAVEVVVEKE